MPEHERKFLVKTMAWMEQATDSFLIRQTYLRDMHATLYWPSPDYIELKAENSTPIRIDLPTGKERKSLEKDITAIYKSLPENKCLSLDDERLACRVRRKKGVCIFTLKQSTKHASKKHEIEFPIDETLAGRMEALGGGIVEKTRYIVPYAGSKKHQWEIDIFHGENNGLVIAELENPPRHVKAPEWLGQEAKEKRYSNSRLAFHPYSEWTHEQKQDGHGRCP